MGEGRWRTEKGWTRLSAEGKGFPSQLSAHLATSYDNSLVSEIIGSSEGLRV